MKKLFFALLVAISLQPAFGQDESEIRTLLGNDVSHGGYLGFTSGYSLIDHKDAFIIGGQLCWVIDHSLALGIGGNGFVNNLSHYEDMNGSDFSLNGGYGGLYFSPILMGKKPIHVAFPVTFGAGGVALTETWYDSANDYYDGYVVEHDIYLVAEPGVEVEQNLVKFMRIAFGAHYRFTSGIHISGSPSNALNGFSGTFSLRLGWF